MSWLHLEDTTPTARKAYRCHLCGHPIQAGETHVKRAGIGEDGPTSVRMHPACERVTVANDWDEHRWMCHDSAEFRDELAEYLANQPRNSHEE